MCDTNLVHHLHAVNIEVEDAGLLLAGVVLAGVCDDLILVVPSDGW